MKKASKKAVELPKVYPLYTDYDFHFIVLGVGGTGSELVPKLCRQLSFKIGPGGDFKHSIILADKDLVEEKNLLRQNFFMSDVHKNKAETIAQKCSAVFNIPVLSYPYFVENAATLTSLIGSGKPGSVPFIVGCLDNVPTRIMIHDFMQTYSAGPIFYLDAGNTEFSGQSILSVKMGEGNSSKISVHKSITDYPTCYDFELPDIIDYFPDMKLSTEKFASDMSCAELAVSDPQAADVNIESACVLYEFIMNCLRGNIEYHMVTFNTKYSNRRVTFNDENVLKEHGIKRFPREKVVLEDVMTDAPEVPTVPEVLTDVTEGTEDVARIEDNAAIRIDGMNVYPDQLNGIVTEVREVPDGFTVEIYDDSEEVPQHTAVDTITQEREDEIDWVPEY